MSGLMLSTASSEIRFALINGVKAKAMTPLCGGQTFM